MRDSDRRFRNEPELVEGEKDELAPYEPNPKPPWLPEKNSARAALASTVRARRVDGGAGSRARGARGASHGLDQALSRPGGDLESELEGSSPADALESEADSSPQG
jgi:hypothetical protein